MSRSLRAVIFIATLTLVAFASYEAGTKVDADSLTMSRAILLGTAPTIGTPGFDTRNPCDGSTDESACWKSFYAAIIERRGAIPALRDLAERYAAGGYPRYFCHALLHDIGAAAGREFGDVGAAYQHGMTFCRAGYYHGVLEGIFGDDPEGSYLKNLDSVCARMEGRERYSYHYFSCVHGIGHGLMAYYDHNIFDALEGCRKLSGAWEQTSCFGGVFMENVISDSPETPSKYLRSDDLMYPCAEVSDDAKTQCYAMQSSHVLANNGGDFPAVFKLCAGLSSEYTTTCFMSIGRDASGWSYGNAETVLNYCANGAAIEARRDCLIGAAVDFIQSVGPDAARDLCLKGEESVRDACTSTVDWHISFSQ